MKPLADTKKELLTLITEDIGDTIKAMKALLPGESERHKEILALEGLHNQNNRDRLSGLVSNEQSQIAYNQVRKALLDLIDALEESDFQAGQAATLGIPQKTKSAKTCSVLYRLPGAMPLGEKSKCIVRVALEEESIIHNFELDEQVQLRPSVLASDIMLVELSDPSDDQPFRIHVISSPEQFIEEGEYTEWLFYITPLIEGVFPLLLKVSTVEQIESKPQKREIVLEQSVVIVTGGAAANETTPEEGTSA